MASFDYDSGEVDHNGYDPSAVYEQQPRSFDEFDSEGRRYDDEGVYSPADPGNGNASEEINTGAKLPAPEEMEPEESSVLREWKRKKAVELEEKAMLSREKHEQVIEAAKLELAAFYDKRAKQVEQGKLQNREKEKAFVTNLQNLNTKAGGNYWEAVVAHVNFDVPTGKKDAKTKSKEGPVRSSILLADAKPGKHTDLTRMRQILLKLKHSPPMKGPTSAAHPLPSQGTQIAA